MKSLYFKITAFSLFVLLFASCKKDETRAVAGTGTSPVLTSTAQTTMVLTEATAANNAGVFSWSASDFGYTGNLVSYTLQVAVSGTNFANAKEITAGTEKSTTVTVATLNSLVNQLNLATGVNGKVDVRIKATISDKYPAAYSNVLTYTVNPYQIIIFYPSLYVPGAYQNWTPATAPRISSVADNQVYEGYIYFSTASEFKINPAATWDHSYGTNSTGTITLDGGGNLSLSSPGYYLLKADTKLLTWSATKTTWSVLGTAVGTETPLTFDPATNLWTVTKALSAGTLTFRANGADAIKFGSADPANGKLVSNGTAIPVAAAGTYKITFNVSNPGNYVYSIVAQ
jgi:hypothetical protein